MTEEKKESIRNIIIAIVAVLIAIGIVVGVTLAGYGPFAKKKPADTTEQQHTSTVIPTDTTNAGTDAATEAGTTAADISTEDVTTAADITTADVTAADVTTADVTTADVTTADVTTDGTTTDAVTTADDKPATTEADTTSGSGETQAPEDTTAEEIPEDPTEPQETEPGNPVCAHTNTEVRDARAATCNMTGFTGNTYCRDCGELIKAGTNTALAAHTPVTVAEVPATCQSKGTTAGTRCSVCNMLLSGCTETPYAAHTPVIDEAVAVTCTRNGLTEGSHCSVCNTVLVAQTVIPSSQGSHDFSIVSYTVEPQVGMVGYTVYKCSVCGAEDENGRDIVPMLEGDYAQQHRGDPVADTSNVQPPAGASPVESIDIYMSYELCPPDLTKIYDEELDIWYYRDFEQPAVLIARDGTAIYGEWVFDGGREEEDTALGLPLPGWTFYMDFKSYPLGVSTYGWCYNKVYNTIVWGWWFWSSYGMGAFTPLDNVPGKTRLSLYVDYEDASPDDAQLIKNYKRGR